jgi:TonB family protein
MGSKNLNPIDITENNSGRFMSLSVLIHAAMLACVALMNIPASDLIKKDIVEFEVESDTAAMKAIPDGEPVPETQGPVKPAEPLVEKAIAPEAPVAKAAPAVPVAAAAPKLAPAPAPMAKAAPVAAPDTLDDIQAPELETSDSGEVPVAQLDEKDLQEDFDKVDNKHQKALAVVKQSLEKETEEAANETDAALAEAEQETKVEAQAIAQAQEVRRAKDAAAIAAAKASEDEASAKAAQKAAAYGEGQGNSGSPEPTMAVAGIPGGVRSLDQMRQMPGNKFPQYSSEERLARQEGKAVFYAYVNKDGSLAQFKLGQTTGYRNLDSKTLTALKKWKFYPGQEGWVEMPFEWALKGDALEAGGTLRK